MHFHGSLYTAMCSESISRKGSLLALNSSRQTAFGHVGIMRHGTRVMPKAKESKRAKRERERNAVNEFTRNFIRRALLALAHSTYGFSSLLSEKISLNKVFVVPQFGDFPRLEWPYEYEEFPVNAVKQKRG